MQSKSQKLFDEKNTLNLWLFHEERHLKTKQNKTKKELLHASFFDTNLLWNKEH